MSRFLLIFVIAIVFAAVLLALQGYYWYRVTEREKEEKELARRLGTADMSSDRDSLFRLDTRKKADPTSVGDIGGSIAANLESLLMEARQARHSAAEFERRWDEFAVSIITLLHRSKDLEAVRGVYEHVVEGLQGLGVDVIDPRQATSVSELHHRVVAVDYRAGVQPGGVIRVAAPGLRRGKDVIRHAEVIVQSATAAKQPAAAAASKTPPQAQPKSEP